MRNGSTMPKFVEPDYERWITEIKFTNPSSLLSGCVAKQRKMKDDSKRKQNVVIACIVTWQLRAEHGDDMI